MDTRLPAHIEAGGLLRAVESAGGFASVIARGERDAGTLLVICCEKGRDARLYERMPQADGTRSWSVIRVQDYENPREFWDYCSRRQLQDPDVWIVELDIANAERFIGLSGTRD
ncbi:DUF1491 family protein [Altererythrobacter xixiisoli]|uniref:DUF1491 family protein n=1 Tax=Croceibacterium xixiisoli TaxID=1476466 RepID=A0A6I4TST8_9SPHN|nr:DUF1491 family protein [Croceibacterium xixiisoli]MXO97443.1 DUF1491 family protein [Croceibacterium xixiisoli]